jgi:hypothetical protein
MSTIEEIEKVIERLPREELLRLSDWIAERAEDAWDDQIEADVASGSLDEIADRAIRTHRGEGSSAYPASDE